MNHFLLPEYCSTAVNGFDSAANYGCYAMELLLN
jgi:chemotaxis receptor (MCP) glutamine deamidase CheD